MLPKGHRHRSVRPAYVATRGVDPTSAPEIPALNLHLSDDLPHLHTIPVPTAAAGLRLDQYLAQAIPEISRSRVQLLIEHGQVQVNDAPAKPKQKLAPGDTVTISGAPHPPPLNATAEDIPLSVVFEDEYLAVIDKPAGMQVHAGAAAPEPNPETRIQTPDPRSSGTLVNALLHHFHGQLSTTGGNLRPGIVHRLDKQTSGLLLVAKDDLTHRRLADLFAARKVHKTYLALVHGNLRPTDTTVDLPIGRDLVRRTRMTTRRAPGSPGVRSARSHIHVLDRLQTPHGPFTLVQVTIETGRTHQIRVHLQALGHRVVGDTLYGAPRQIHTLTLPRNFLHAAQLSLTHPRTGHLLDLSSPLPPDLTTFLQDLAHQP